LDAIPGWEAGLPDGGHGLDAPEGTSDDAAEPGVEAPGETSDASDEVSVPRPFEPAVAVSLQALLDEYITFSGEPGVALSVQAGDRLFSGAAGVADLKTGAALTPLHTFRVGSNSKPYMAVLVLQLAEEGKLGLDDPVTLTLPQYEQWSGITLRQLLGMQSGIPDYLQQQELWLEGFSHPGKVYTPEELLAYVAGEPLAFQPGQEGDYSNSNYLLIGLVIEAVTGNALADEVRTRIVEPLGLVHTRLATDASTDGLAHGYLDAVVAASVLGVPPQMVALLPEDLVVDGTLIDSTSLFDPSVAWAAGGILSTPDDALVFLRALMQGRLLNPASLQAMMDFHPVTILGGPTSYGLGLIESDTAFGKAYGHGGLTWGYTASVQYLPDRDAGIAQMNNTYPEQSWMVQPTWLATALDGVEAPYVACRPPTGLLDPVDEPFLTVRFHGTITADGTNPPVPGVGSGLARIGGKRVALQGLWNQAVSKQQAGTTRLEVATYGPGGDNGVAMRSSLLSIDPALFLGVGEEGRVDLAAMGPYQVFAAVLEYYRDAGAADVNRFCFAAVADTTRLADSALGLCDPAGISVQPGQPLGLFARVALDTDPGRVAAYVAPLQMGRCQCRVGLAPQWQVCE
jgi:D-alanyl-D-alanine carboxypeptidase